MNMTVEIDKTRANTLLWNLYRGCSQERIASCKIRKTVDFVMTGSRCLTYRYILFTALLAKSCDPDADILSLQAGDDSEGAYDARTLASKVVFPFQKNILGNVLDGSNEDPLVNKPGRFPRLHPSNATASGDPKTALEMLCDDLPKISDSTEARQCLGYMISQILDLKEERDLQQKLIDDTTKDMGVVKVRRFMDELLNQGFGGAALVLVATALYNLQYPGEAYRIVPHPVNQAGVSKRQFSDLDLFHDGKPFMGTELKDKLFTASDLEHAAQTAYNARASSLLFVAGRQSNFASQPPTYYGEVRDRYAEKGLYVGVTSIDALMDTVISSHADEDVSGLLNIIKEAAEDIGAVEAQTWVYRHIADLKSDSMPEYRVRCRIASEPRPGLESALQRLPAHGTHGEWCEVVYLGAAVGAGHRPSATLTAIKGLPSCLDRKPWSGGGDACSWYRGGLL